jgi:hypothetical protein
VVEICILRNKMFWKETREEVGKSSNPKVMKGLARGYNPWSHLRGSLLQELVLKNLVFPMH